MNGFSLRIRNFLGALLAVALIASGRVRRARKKALEGGLATALYFHKPHKLFPRCVDWLKKHGYTFISAAELTAFLRGDRRLPPGAVWLSFDDGCRELLSEVLPEALRYNIPVTLFVPSGIVGGDGRFPWMNGRCSARQALTVEEVKAISRYPQVTIGSHTVSHPVATRCTQAELHRELTESKQALESWLGSPVELLSYPYGKFDERVVQAAQAAGYALAATVESAFVSSGADPFRVPRFSIADEISLPEAICNMVGVWRPVIEPIKSVVGRFRGGESQKPAPMSDELGQGSTAAVRTRV